MSDFTLHLGDCIQGMAAMEDRSVDHVIADPEYSARVHGRFGTEDRSDGTEARGDIGFAPLTEESALRYAAQYCRIAKRWIILCCDEVSLVIWKNAIEASGGEYVRKGTWVKTNPMPQMTGDRPAVGTEEIMIAHAPRESGRMRWNGGGRSATYHVPVTQGDERIHPAQKPLGLLNALIRDFTDPGDLILDSHAGSGTTGLAALELGRRFVGFEKDPAHHARAMERLTDAQRQEHLFRSAPMVQQRLI